MTKTRKKTWELVICYSNQYYWKGYDSKIEALVGRESSSSGMDLFEGGMRDLLFTFATKRGATNAVKRLRQVFRNRRVVKTIEIEEVEE